MYERILQMHLVKYRVIIDSHDTVQSMERHSGYCGSINDLVTIKLDTYHITCMMAAMHNGCRVRRLQL